MGTTVRAALRLPLLAGLLVAHAGCDSSGVGTTYPVAGSVTVNGKPLSAGTATVLFKADTAKGNTTPFEPAGTVDERGQYTVQTNGKAGAPPGWYKVVVTAFEGRPQHLVSKHDRRPVVKSSLPARYGTAATSTLAIEIVADPAPAAYDLKLTSP